MARKDLPSPTAPNFLARVREEVHALLGKLGNGADRALTLRDAIESGVIVPGPGGSLIPGPGAGAAEEPDLTPPPQPGAFTATGAISHFLISQAQPFYTQGHGHSRTVVYGAQWVSGQLPVFADAVELDRFAGTVRAVASNPATTWHLWIKWESLDGVLSATPSGGTNGVAVTTGQDVALLLDALAGQITSTELASSLSTPIGQIPSISGTAAEALSKANANLAAIGTIQTELATLSGTPDYNAGTTYELDDIVKYSGGLYRALGATTGNLPTNTTYWQKIGDYASLGDAVSAHAAQLSDHETRITDAEGDLTVEASARETLATQVRGSYAGTDIAMVSAGLIHSERQARTMADATEVSARQALSAKLTGVTDPASLALGTLASGLLYDEKRARVDNDDAQVERIETMEAAVNSPSTGLATKASLTQLATVESNAASALATAQTTLNSTIAGLGGENLYTDRDPLVSGPTMYGDVVYIKNGPINPLGLVPGEALTLSADLARDAAAASDGAHATLYMWWQNEAGSWVGSAAISGYTDVPTRPSQSITLPAAASDMVVVGVGVYKQGGSTNVAGTATATRIQIERGSVATAYKVGLRNASAAITTLQQTQASQGLSIANLTTAVQAAQDTADSKASTSALTETNTNVSNLAGTVSSQAWQITTLQSRVSRVVNYLIRSAGSDSQGSQYPGVFSETGAALTAAVRSYILVVFNGSTGAIESAVHYDVFGGGEFAGGRNAASMAAAMNALGPDKVVAVYTWDEPRGNRLTGGLPEAMYRCGASRSIFGAPDSVFRYRSAYILVGIPGIGEGAGIERYAGSVDNDPLAYCEYSLQLVNGRPVGMGGNPLNATVQTEIATRATQTGELYAQYTVKTDVGGLVSGYGLASSANNAAPTSAFGVQAGQFFVAPPAVASATAPTVGLFKGYAWRDTVANVTKYWTGNAWSTSPQALPFVVQAVPTTINGVAVPAGIYAADAFIQNGTITNLKVANGAIDDLKVASVSVSKLTAGSIAVGQFAQSTGYVAGSAGWRINGDGTAEFSGVVVRGTIFASQGAIGGWNIGSNYLQSTTYVLGESGTRLNSDGTGQIGGVTIYAQGLGAGSTAYDTGNGAWIGRDGKFSLKSATNSLKWDGGTLQINGGGTFSGSLSAATGSFAGSLNAATGTFSGSLTADAVNAVNTINLAGQAVTIPVSAYTAGGVTVNNAASATVQSCSILSTGAPIQIIAQIQIRSNGNYDYVNEAVSMRVLRNGVDIRSVVTSPVNTQTVQVIAVLSDTPGAGLATYTIQLINSTNSSFVVSFRSLLLLETKK